ncbi:hypothetical protein ACFLVZ_01955 [Chloroflexota bacterium]
MENRNQKKRCPKCEGNLFQINDVYGPYEQCLQCGFIKYPGIIDNRVTEEDLVTN